MGPFGHLAVGFGVKSVSREIPLWVLLVAAYFIEIVYFILPLFGIDSWDYSPWSHSLLGAVMWSVIFGLVYLIIRRKFSQAAIVSGVVFAHWILDFIAWNDLPLAPGMPENNGLGLFPAMGFSMEKLGLNWTSIKMTLLDISLLGVGVLLYALKRRSDKKKQIVQGDVKPAT